MEILSGSHRSRLPKSSPAKILHALQWLQIRNKYFVSIEIDHSFSSTSFRRATLKSWDGPGNEAMHHYGDCYDNNIHDSSLQLRFTSFHRNTVI